MNWHRFNWLDYVLIPLLSASMRAAWMVPLVNALLASGFFVPRGLHLPFWLPLLLLVGGSTMAHALSARPVGRIIAGLAGLLAVFLVLLVVMPGPDAGLLDWLASLYRQATVWTADAPAVWVVFAVGAGLWMRAITVDWSEVEPLRRGFMTGVIALALMTLAGATRHSLGLGLINGIMEPVLVFLASGMGALALTDISRTVRQSLRAGGGMPSLGRFWYLVVVVVVAVVVLSGWAATFLVDPESVVSVVRWFSPVLRIITGVLAYIIVAFAYIIFRLLAPLIQWLNSLISEEAREELALPTPEPPESFEEFLSRPEEVAGVPPWIGTLVILLIVAVVVLLFVWLLRRRFVSSAEGVQETREVDWSLQLMRDQVSQWLARRRPQRRSQFVPLEPGEDPRVIIRQAYRRMLKLTAERGLNHRPWETPWTYGRSLSHRLPDIADSIEALTRAYNVARYSPLPPDEGTVERAREALGRIESWLFRYETPDSDGRRPSELGSPSPG
ncbi:MAG: DUF4129 domain-containing protein [Anaerolineae bacterium]|nr:DUF4129 domain-containing protein [Anaerolineae bacterium]